jgi:rubrerythrin
MGTKTEQNLKDAFAGESQANRRYLYFANKADIEGQNDVAALFRSTAEGETGHAHGHLEFLEAVGDPATGLPIGSSRQNLAAAVAGETHEYTDMYPGMAKQARDEGFDEIADWFETLAKAERSHANRYTQALDTLGPDRSHGPWEPWATAAGHSVTACSAKATSKPPATRSLGRTRLSTTRPHAKKSSSGCSTSATAAAVA